MKLSHGCGNLLRASLVLAIVGLAVRSAPRAAEQPSVAGGASPSRVAAAPAVAPATAPTPAVAPAPAGTAPAAPSRPAVQYRKLGPGVLISIPPDRKVEDCFSRHDIPELLKVDPNFKFAQNVTFRRDIWTLELDFKPMRVISADMPQPSGMMQSKQIWYLIYKVTNTGKVMRPVPVDRNELLATLDAAMKDPERAPPQPQPKADAPKEGTSYIQNVDEPVRFTLQFLLNSWKPNNPNFNKWYPSRSIPTAIGPIQLREDPNRPLLNEMDRELKPGESAWGVATWEGIDPISTHFSVYVYGLTNAYKWNDDPSQIKPEADARQRVGAGRQIFRKALQLNFWRPGDDQIKDSEIRFGIPGEVDYQWVYR